MKAFAYSGQGAVYIIDGNNGEFLMDTWHKDLGNIWSLSERTMAPGYNHEQLKQGLSDGKRNYVVFVSETTREIPLFLLRAVADQQLAHRSFRAGKCGIQQREQYPAHFDRLPRI